MPVASRWVYGMFFNTSLFHQVYTQPWSLHLHIGATALLAVVQVTQPVDASMSMVLHMASTLGVCSYQLLQI